MSDGHVVKRDIAIVAAVVIAIAIYSYVFWPGQVIHVEGEHSGGPPREVASGCRDVGPGLVPDCSP